MAIRAGTLLLTGVALAAAPSLAAGSDAAAAFVARLNATIDRTASGGARALCDDVIGWAVDVDVVAPVASAGAWAAMSEPDRASYRDALVRRLARDCERLARDALGKPVDLAGARQAAGQELTVATRPAGEPLSKPLVWRGRVDPEGSFRVTDVLVDGRSAVLLLSHDAGEALRRGGEPSAALVQALRR